MAPSCFQHPVTNSFPLYVHPHPPILSSLLCLHTQNTCCFLKSPVYFPGSEVVYDLSDLKVHSKYTLRLVGWLLTLGAGGG